MRKIFLILISIFFVPIFAGAETVSNIQMIPNLDISYFGAYKIRSNISGSPTSVSVQVNGINGDGGSYWNYYASSTPYYDLVTKTMTATSTYYESSNIYPDSIYPEIFFAPSAITFNNNPTNIDLRRNNYHLFHLQNPYTMTASSSFFIEMNAVPVSTVNSADLEVYLVKNGKTTSFFSSDWRNSPDVELVGTFDKNSNFHHIHNAYSSHRLIALNTNSDGTIGTKNINVSGDFWIILYSNSPNTNRGWNLRYHDTPICTNSNGWYSGNQTGWTITNKGGCPDSHVHIARRDPIIADGISALITANYSEGTATSSETFLFYELPNLPPSQSSFISPTINGIYDGGIGDKINISWSNASDPNEGDLLNYSIYLMDSIGATSTTIANATTSTNAQLDISSVPNGLYSVRGVVCDNNVIPLCTYFDLPGTFTIEKVTPIYSLSSVSISSNNATTSLARAGNIVTLSFTANGSLTSASVNLYSNGIEVNDTPIITNIGNDYTVTYTVNENDASGFVSFIIRANNLDLEYFDTTDNSSVTVFKYSLLYSSGANGTISGITTQSIHHGSDGTTVTAIPNTGYHFTSWSDGVLTASRTDTNVTANISVYPIFTIDASAIPTSNASRQGSSVASRFQNLIQMGQYATANELRAQYPNLFNNLLINQKYNWSRDLSKGMTGDDVLALQKFLNAQGYTLAKTGPGSYGNETTFFGILTKNALSNFQKANKIYPPIGYFGPKTKNFISSHNL